jgi:predicted PhzF superfamily epimerase YddE/YHI9
MVRRIMTAATRPLSLTRAPAVTGDATGPVPWPMALELTVIDAFTDRPFSGNPAAIAVVAEFPDEARMQSVAAEMNLSETAFVVERGERRFDLRWFTPTTEVDLCGHATLAAAHLLAGPAIFQTKSGELACAPTDDGSIEMEFPADTAVEVPLPADAGLEGVAWFGRGTSDFLAELDSAARVRSLVPDLAAILRLGGRALIVTAPGDREGIDCVSRVFGPAVGIAEDPATGSAHCTLATFWGDRLGRDTLTGEQASPRGAVVGMRRVAQRVVLTGRAVTVSRVSFLV